MTGLLLTVLLLVQGGPASAPAPGTVTGRVLLPDGSPAPGRRVTAMDAASTTTLMGVSVTDEAGRYSLTGLPPGQYRIVAGSLTMPSYFPGVAELKAATAVSVGAQRGVDGIDFRLVPDESRVGPLLASESIVDQAWGAWFAGEAAKSEWTPLLEEKLARQLARADRSTSGEVVIDTLADALIRLNAKPPSSLLQSLYARRPAEALVLMLKVGPAANGALLNVLDSSTDVRWAAAANLLLANRAPGFVAALLGKLRLQAQLLLCDPGPTCREAPRIGWGSAGDFGPPMLMLVPGLPPWPTYTLYNSGNNLLAKGPINVAYTRRVSSTGLDPRSQGSSSSSETTPTATDRLNYIAAAAPGVAIGVQNYEERRVVWLNDETAKTEGESFRKNILARYATLLLQLRTAGVLTAQEAAKLATPNLEFTITDARSR